MSRLGNFDRNRTSIRRYCRTTKYDIDLTKCIFVAFVRSRVLLTPLSETRHFEYHGEKRGDLLMTKADLLAVGDKMEEQIARDKNPKRALDDLRTTCFLRVCWNYFDCRSSGCLSEKPRSCGAVSYTLFFFYSRVVASHGSRILWQ